MNLMPRRRNQSDTWLNPFREFEGMQRHMNPLFGLSLLGKRNREVSLFDHVWSPSVDYEETDGNVLIKADLPGLDKKHITITAREGVLTIKGERTDEHKSSKNGTRSVERFYGQFYREIALPRGVDESKVHAQYKNGVLELTIPKKEEAKSKQIRVDIE